ncbi:cell wall hydrolase [Actibacterium sp. D379-3]
MSYRFVRALCVAMGLFVSTTAGADVTVSTSTDPTAVLDSRLTQLLGTEKTALSAVGHRRLEQLVAPARVVAAPSGAVPAIRYDAAWLTARPAAQGGPEWQCLSEALYFEARGESVKGQFAVAEVILNRVSSPKFPDTVCGVVHQGTGRKYQCQFTYTCDGREEVVHEPAAYTRSTKIARAMLDGAARNLTGGATYYHTHAVNPRWARKFLRTASIGQHLFYRPQVRLSSN